MERCVYLNGTLCIFQKDDIFPICTNSLNLLHKLHVTESFSSLFSSGHGYCLELDGEN